MLTTATGHHRIGDRARFPLGQLGDSDVYRHPFELVAFTRDGAYAVRRLVDGYTRTVSAHWWTRYCFDEHPKRERPAGTARPFNVYGADLRPGNYYVSVRDGSRTGLLAGPFRSHADALGRVDRARQLACDADARAHWYAFGTCRMDDGYTKPGLFNAEVR